MTTQNLFTNRATAKLAADVSSADTALTLVPGGGDWFPSPAANQYFRLVLQKGTGQTDQREYMVCTSRTGDVLTVTRAQEGTPAANFTAGDEASLVATAESLTAFIQRVGATLQGALEVEADPTTPLGIATKQFVETGRLADAPSDDKDYARRNAAWHALGAAAGLAVPIPISAGGTGGVTVLEAQTNLYIPTTTFDDLPPATPKYGDRWIKPSNMVEMVWAPNAGGGGAGIWINPADATSQAYPITIDHGGTGATTLAGARLNLGITNAAGQMVITPDGTAAKPGLVFASEPGLGWYRNGAGQVYMAAGGQNTFGFHAAQTNQTYLVVGPQATGLSALQIWHEPTANRTNTDFFQLTNDATATRFQANAAGTGTAKPVIFGGAPRYEFDNVTHAGYLSYIHGFNNNNAQLVLDKGIATQENNIISTVGGSTTVGGQTLWRLLIGDSSADQAFSIQRYNPAGTFAGSPLTIERTTGNLQFSGVAIFDNVVIRGSHDSRWYQNGAAGNGTVIFQYAAGYYWGWDKANGDLTFWNDNTYWWRFNRSAGEFQMGGNKLTFGGGMALYTASNGDRALAFTNDGWRWQWNGGNLTYFSSSSGNLFTINSAGSVAVAQNLSTAFDIAVGRNLQAAGSVAATGNQIAMTGNTITCNTFGNSSGNIFTNMVAASPGGMYQTLSFQHTPGTFAAMQMQVGGNAFTFNSSGTANAAGAWIDSDRKTKRNIARLPEAATAIVMAVPVVEWDRIGAIDEATGKELHQVGWIAQDVQAVYAKAVYTQHKTRALPPLKEGGPGRVEDLGDQLALDHGAMTAMLWKAFQELNARVAQMEMQ